MGGNRKMAFPEAYPAAFIATLKNGAGILYAEDLPWQPISAAKRFRLFLSVVRETPRHPLYPNAIKRWSVRPTNRALECFITDAGKEIVSLAGPLIDRALAIGENPNPIDPDIR